jgi:uroporphyrinogen decarboxylase
MQIDRLPDKTRFLNALQHRSTGEVSFFDPEIAANIVDEVLERKTGLSLSRLCAKDKVEFLQRAGLDMGYLIVVCDIGRKNKPDRNGQMQYVDGLIKSQADFDKITIPSLDPVRKAIEEFLEAADGTGLGCIFGIQEAAKLARIAIGPTDFAMAMYDDPAFVNELMDRMEEYAFAQIECILEYPVDVLLTTGPVCVNQGPMFSPQMHEEFILPRIERMMELVRPSGVPVILHADGDVSAFLDWIIETKFAGLHPIEPGDGLLDIYDLKKKYGENICFCGNIDNAGILTHGTPDEVRADVQEHLARLSSGGGYVCGSSHEITDITPFENFCALAETICSYKHKTNS